MLGRVGERVKQAISPAGSAALERARKARDELIRARR